MSAQKYFDVHNLRILVSAHHKAIRDLRETETGAWLQAEEIAKALRKVIDFYGDKVDSNLLNHYCATRVETLPNGTIH